MSKYFKRWLKVTIATLFATQLFVAFLWFVSRKTLTSGDEIALNLMSTFCTIMSPILAFSVVKSVERTDKWYIQKNQERLDMVAEQKKKSIYHTTLDNGVVICFNSKECNIYYPNGKKLSLYNQDIKMLADFIDKEVGVIEKYD